MRDVLNKYMESPPVECNVQRDPSRSTRRTLLERMIHFWFHYNLDCYLGSILCSLILLVLSVVLYVREREKDGVSEQSLAAIDLYTSHITASVLLLIGSSLSVWLLSLRRRTSARGAETKKRNAVAQFLPILDIMLKENGDKVPASDEIPNGNDVKVSGTSLTDIYPVYRITAGAEGGQWHRLPSLLLVEGDFIALQLGDTAPADCELVTGSKIGSQQPSSALRRRMSAPELIGLSQNTKPIREPIIVKAGDRVEPSQKLRFENRNVQVCDHLFPPGKSYLPENSRKLLHLTNHSRVFQVLETPIAHFLRKKAGECGVGIARFHIDITATVCIVILTQFHQNTSTVLKKSPQKLRKVEEVRANLYFFAVISLILSYVIIFVRYSRQDIDFSLVLNLPLLAALGSLPIATPLILILLEIIGTSRILVTVHPYSSNVRTVQNNAKLFIQYFVKGLESRFEFSNPFVKDVQESSLVDFPIASSYLYEKLGVVTALSLIDDELACDPISTPQQLLIPTTKGLKLLDLFPKYEEEDSDDDDNNDYVKRNVHARRRAKSYPSSHDSDSEWGDESDDNRDRGVRSTRMRALINLRQRYKKKNLSARKFEPPKPTEVQFEDPNWWHYLPSLKCIGLGSLLVDNKAEDFTATKSPLPANSKDSHAVQADQSKYISGMAESSLISHVSRYYDRSHLRVLSKCIGLTTEPNSFGPKGDITPFEELRRIRVIATRLLHRRMLLDRHQISLEESRSWGRLRPDSTSVIIKDHRSQAYQLLTVGDSRVVMDLCSDSWQGETITSLSANDRVMILENSKTWSLADLDVTAFSYAPIPYKYGQKFSAHHHATERQKSVASPMVSCTYE